MGILFMYYDPENIHCKYKLIMAQNRDEKLDKPSEAADFWDTDENTISGRDSDPPSKGRFSTDSSAKAGTSFGIDLRGRVGAYLDIEDGGGHGSDGHLRSGGVALREFFDYGERSLDAEGEGKRNKNPIGGNYKQALELSRGNYRRYQPFQLITGQCGSYYEVAALKCQRHKQGRGSPDRGLHLRTDSKERHVQMGHDDSGFSEESLRTENSPSPDDLVKDLEDPNRGWRFDYTNTLLNIKEELEPGTAHAFCNSRQHPHSDSPSKTWKKVAEGKGHFLSIIQEHGKDLKNYQPLVKSLLELMKDQNFYLPDRNLENELISLDYDADDIKNLSSIFIRPNLIGGQPGALPESRDIPASQYFGTRTINLLTIDSKNNVDFLESLLHYPVCLKNQVWNPTKFSFNLKVGSHI